MVYFAKISFLVKLNRPLYYVLYMSSTSLIKKEYPTFSKHESVTC
jgi:hypothetical protein